MYFGVVTTGYSTSFFTPTILKQLGWTSVKAQVYSIPIYIVAAVFALLTALATDAARHRYAFIMAGVALATVGYGILLNTKSVSVGARYFALYAITTGGYMAQPITMGWLSNNVAGHYKRAVSSAMQIGIGNLGGIVASNVYLTNQAPTYPAGYGTSLGCLWLCGLAATVMLVGLMFENKARNAGKRDWRYNIPAEERDNMGDDHPSFRFTY